jgi:hypothetical protein
VAEGRVRGGEWCRELQRQWTVCRDGDCDAKPSQSGGGLRFRSKTLGASHPLNYVETVGHLAIRAAPKLLPIEFLERVNCWADCVFVDK